MPKFLIERRLVSANRARILIFKPVFQAVGANAHVSAWQDDRVSLFIEANDAHIIISDAEAV